MYTHIPHLYATSAYQSVCKARNHQILLTEIQMLRESSVGYGSALLSAGHQIIHILRRFVAALAGSSSYFFCSMVLHPGVPTYIQPVCKYVYCIYIICVMHTQYIMLCKHWESCMHVWLMMYMYCLQQWTSLPFPQTKHAQCALAHSFWNFSDKRACTQALKNAVWWSFYVEDLCWMLGSLCSIVVVKSSVRMANMSTCLSTLMYWGVTFLSMLSPTNV